MKNDEHYEVFVRTCVGLDKYSTPDRVLIKKAQQMLIENPGQYLSFILAEGILTHLSKKLSDMTERETARFYLKNDPVKVTELPLVVSSLEVMLAAGYPEGVVEEDRKGQRELGYTFLADNPLVISRLEVVKN